MTDFAWAIVGPGRIAHQFADAVRLQARVTLAPTGVDQRVAGSIDFPGGVISQFAFAYGGTADSSMRIFGDRGWISLGPRFWQATEATLQVGVRYPFESADDAPA